MEKQEKKGAVKRDIVVRVTLLYGVFVLMGAMIVLRLIWIQFMSPEVSYNAGRLMHRIFYTDTIPPQRGTILSRDGDPLATSIFRYQVDFDYASEGLDSLELYTEHVDSLSKLLSIYFKDKSAAQYREMMLRLHKQKYRLERGRDTSYLRSKSIIGRFFNRMAGREYITHRIYDTIRDHRPVALLPRMIDYEEWQELRRYPLLNWNLGMTYKLREEDQRVYPQGDMALRTVGNQGDDGRFGVESAYDELLAGQEGIMRRQRIARGFSGRVMDDINREVLDGADVVTTIDVNVQDVAHNALREQMQAQDAIWGTTIVMEVSTGDILAIANIGRNSRGEYVENNNYAMRKRVEMGSVIKAATVMAMLDDLKLPESTTYDTEDGRRVSIAGAGVQDSHGGFNDMDLKTAVSESSNVYFAKAVWEHYGKDVGRFSDFFKTLGLDQPVGFEDPAFGEIKPYLPDLESINGRFQAMVRMSFGYVLELTPLQVATFYNAIANDGRMVAPRLVKAIQRNGKVVEEFDTQVLQEEICSRSTLRKVQGYLEEVCRSGTAKRYLGDTTLFRAAAKTGTAQYSQDGIKYSDGYYIGSMAAYLPAEDPHYTILTTIHTRRGGGRAYYGGPLTGPVVKRLAHYLHSREDQWLRPLEDSDLESTPERIKGGELDQVKRVARGLDTRIGDIDSDSDWGVTRMDSTQRLNAVGVVQDLSLMPDVRGMGLKDALFILENRGLSVSFTGSGAVTRQSIVPGRKIVAGQSVNITLK